MPTCHVEGGQGVQVTASGGEEVRLPLTQQLQRSPESALRTQGALGDGAHHAEVPREQPDNPGGVPVPDRAEDECGCELRGSRHRISCRSERDPREFR